MELLLLACAVQRPSCLFLAGDTAQTIASGVGFRFEELKSIIFREELRHRELAAAAAAAGAAGQAAALLGPQQSAGLVVHSLRVNYRSHNGLVRAAGAVSGLLTQLFPDTTDRLPPELGWFEGPRPLLKTLTRLPDMLANILDGEAVSADGDAEVLDFGANQVVLVRDEAARERLLTEAPEFRLAKAQILTIGESKGLEFNDVFIWDFFRESPCGQEWRAVAQAAADALQARGEPLPSGLSPLPFDPRAHAQLGECLKLFYVAVTRARRRVVVFDRDPRKRAAMFALLGRAVVGAGGAPVAELCDLVRRAPTGRGLGGAEGGGRDDEEGEAGGPVSAPTAGLAQVRRLRRKYDPPNRSKRPDAATLVLRVLAFR